MKIRKSAERGHFDFNGLKTYHTFSFGQYHNPAHTHFGPLRVINEDWIAPARGFGMHPHANMEIVTYVLQGTLQHTDSIGHTSLLKPGDVQRMTAGSGIEHSEVNGSDKEPLHLLQIWIFPQEKNLSPSYEEKYFPPAWNHWTLIASPQGEQTSLKIHQDVKVFVGRLEGQKLHYALSPGRMAWIQLMEGSLLCNGQRLRSGDGAATNGGNELSFESSHAYFLLFDLPQM